MIWIAAYLYALGFLVSVAITKSAVAYENMYLGRVIAVIVSIGWPVSMPFVLLIMVYET